jgi:hypothetical protein
MLFKFSEFIKEYYDYPEGTRSKEISLEETVIFYKENCTDWDLNGIQIYRGTEGAQFDYSINDPSKSIRISRNTSNYYTLLLDTFSVWKNYPKRSKSLICSTHLVMSMSFGKVSIVIPVNGSKIGIVPTYDIWSGFENSGLYILKQLDVFNQIIDSMFKFYLKKSDYWNMTGEDLINSIDLIGNKLREDNNYEKFTHILKHINYFSEHDIIEILKFIKDFKTSSYSNLSIYLSKFMSPDRNRFELITTKEQNVLEKHDKNEVWTDGKCLTIYRGLFSDFKKQISKP